MAACAATNSSLSLSLFFFVSFVLPSKSLIGKVARRGAHRNKRSENKRVGLGKETRNSHPNASYFFSSLLPLSIVETARSVRERERERERDKQTSCYSLVEENFFRAKSEFATIKRIVLNDTLNRNNSFLHFTCFWRNWRVLLLLIEFNIIGTI